MVNSRYQGEISHFPRPLEGNITGVIPATGVMLKCTRAFKGKTQNLQFWYGKKLYKPEMAENWNVKTLSSV